MKARIIGRDRALFESMSLVLQEGLLPEADRGTTAMYVFSLHLSGIHILTKPVQVRVSAIAYIATLLP